LSESPAPGGANLDFSAVSTPLWGLAASLAELAKTQLQDGLSKFRAAIPYVIALRPLAGLVPPAKVSNVTFSEDPHLGPYLLVEVEGSASEALELWEELVEKLYPQLKAPIFVVWSGDANVEPAELGRRVGALLARMRVSLFTLREPVDVVKELREEW